MTIEELVKKTGTQFILGKAAIKLAQKTLIENETPIFAMNTNATQVPVNGELKVNPASVKNKINGVFVITDRRVYFVNSTLGSANMKEINIENITSLDSATLPGFGGQIRIKGITEMIVIDVKNIKLLEEIQNILNKYKNNSNETLNVPDELKKYKELLDSGAITNEEYETMKKKLLNL